MSELFRAPIQAAKSLARERSERAVRDSLKLLRIPIYPGDFAASEGRVPDATPANLSKVRRAG